MPDPRYAKLADVLVNYSTRVQPDELVRITGSAVTRPLLVELYRAVLQAGGHPYVEMRPDECDVIRLAQGNDDQLRFENPLLQYEVENIDVYIGLWGSDNTKALSTAEPRKQALVSQGRKPFLNRMMERAAEGKLRWCGSQYPCNAAAQDAERSLAEYEEFVFSAGLLHLDDPAAAWHQVSERQQRVVDYLADKKEIRFVTPQGTDLTVRVDGRTWINCDGRHNFPDGEVFTGPHEDATDGTVMYSFPAVFKGREADGVRLTFNQGRVVGATAEKGEDYLIAMLDQDDGGRVLGEIAIGTNYSITDYTKNTLFDEKIGGTFHAAVGMAYPESGGTNESGLHWDMVCDLRRGGRIYADGKLISENGQFLDPTWPR